MKSTAIHRLETLLQTRRLESTLTRAALLPPEEAVSSGLTTVDTALGGGWRRGEVSEVIGPRSSGRTSLVLSTMAAAIRHGEDVALVDAFDRFDPVTAAEAGLDLTRLLWVRGPGMTLELMRPAMLDAPVRRAVRALDLIIRARTVGVAVLDLADVSPRAVASLPWTTWMRLAQSAEGSRTVCLLIGDASMGKSARGVSVRLAATRRWTGDHLQSRRWAGLDLHVTVGRAHLNHDIDRQSLAHG